MMEWIGGIIICLLILIIVIIGCNKESSKNIEMENWYKVNHFKLKLEKKKQELKEEKRRVKRYEKRIDDLDNQNTKLIQIINDLGYNIIIEHKTIKVDKK